MLRPIIVALALALYGGLATADPNRSSSSADYHTEAE
jgi:hypothetical protein